MNIPKFWAYVPDQNYMGEVSYINFTDKELSFGVNKDQEELLCDFNDCILMQSTGLTDKNGVEVLERDLIKLSTMFSIDKDDEYFHEGIYEVQMSPIYGVMLFFKKLTFEDGARNQYPIWGHIGFGDGLTKDREHQKSLAVSNRYIDYSDNFEVISSIHQNGDLLNV